MLWSPKMDILATRPGGADLLRSGLRGGLTIRHIKTAASAALYSIQLDSKVVTASWPEIETLITDPEQPDSDLNNPQDWSLITKLPSLNKTIRRANPHQEELE